MNAVDNTKFSIFVSYHASQEVKHLLSELKKDFAFHGINFFLAHEDIIGGRDGREEIGKELNKSDVFLIYINDNLKKSSYCNQEIGWALSKDKPIVRLGSSDYNGHYGWDLLPDKQACCKLNSNNISECFCKIVSEISRNEQLTNQILKNKLEYLPEKYTGFEVYRGKNGGFHFGSNAPQARAERRSIINQLPKSKINLIPNDLDDYSFKTIFHLFIGQKEVGMVKIGYKGQVGGSATYQKLPKHFLWLSEDFISKLFYKKEKERIPDLDNIFLSLRECSTLNKKELGSFKGEEFYQKSLLR